ncbi:contact-dependent growth inhibition system immunity protein [Ralstonia mannitolilytica]|uniref:contact-dependent growth inhibition system immunity protein n=1 Tax=Ralstonia mannitolilytica TaxID=105219 RepID=UPI00292D7B06|nr:contact-dependent growth inhibition system immunity protein [Ralstonia mannitolilytica]
MKKYSAWASVMFNGDFYEIVTMSKGMMSYAEPSAAPCYLSPDADDALLGKALREAFSKSQRVEVDKFQEIFHSGIVQKVAKEREAWVMNAYGYKTKRAMFQKMDACSASLCDDKIEIQPLHQQSLDGYTAKKDTGPLPLDLPVTASDAEVGAALREGFRRCTSEIR